MSKKFKISVKYNEPTPKGFIKALYRIEEKDLQEFSLNFIDEIFKETDPEGYKEIKRIEAETLKRRKYLELDAEIRRLKELRAEL